MPPSTSSCKTGWLAPPHRKERQCLRKQPRARLPPSWQPRTTHPAARRHPDQVQRRLLTSPCRPRPTRGGGRARSPSRPPSSATSRQSPKTSRACESTAEAETWSLHTPVHLRRASRPSSLWTISNSKRLPRSPRPLNRVTSRPRSLNLCLSRLKTVPDRRCRATASNRLGKLPDPRVMCRDRQFRPRA